MSLKIRWMPFVLCASVLASSGALTVNAEDNPSIALPPPRLESGVPLMQALQARQSRREFSSKPLSRQVLADLLWAAYGVNRPEAKKRTAPSAHNRQEIDIYVAMADGLFHYDAFAHALLPIVKQDIRAHTGRQQFPAQVPLNLIYVVDYNRFTDVPREAALEVAAIATGAIVQNVYLFCASEGLATVVRGWIDKKILAEAMQLKPTQYILVAQSVGFPLQ